MFSDMDSDDFANLGKLAGTALFAISLFLPSVHAGPTNYWGFICAAWTLFGTYGFFVNPDGLSWVSLFFMISGWITPLVALGIFIHSDKVKSMVALVLPVLMLAPWIFFAWPESGWGAVGIRPSIGHYLWTVGCLLVFTPQYLKALAVMRRGAR
jgi:hypothetical protein